MIELKVGDKFVSSYTKEVLTVANIYKLGNLTCCNVKEDVYVRCLTEVHVDWEATKKLHEVGKTYEWHEAIKMALEGKIMNDLKTGVYIAEKNGEVRVSNEPTFEKHLKIGVTNRLLESKFVEYIKPITLTDDEKTILRNVGEKYKWVARENNDDLWLYGSKPHKLNDGWYVSDGNGDICFLESHQHLFQQIKWEDKEPCLIADLIK